MSLAPGPRWLKTVSYPRTDRFGNLFPDGDRLPIRY